MKPLLFRTHHDRLYTYHYVSGESRVVDKHWPGLFEEPAANATEKTPYTEFNVNNNNCEEVAIYLGLAWRISYGLSRSGIPRYYLDEAARSMKKKFDLVRWEYRVAANRYEGFGEDKGFVRAPVCMPERPSMSSSRQTDQHLTGLFEIETFSDLVALQKATLGDASSELNLFCLKPGRKEQLLVALRNNRRPVLHEMLGSGELFIDIIVGVDEGYYDSILICTPDDMTERLGKLVSEYARSISDYESRVEHIHSVDEFLQNLRSLAFGGEST